MAAQSYWIKPNGEIINLEQYGDNCRQHHGQWLYQHRNDVDISRFLEFINVEDEIIDQVLMGIEEENLSFGDYVVSEFLKQSGWVRHTIFSLYFGGYYHIENTVPETFNLIQDHFYKYYQESFLKHINIYVSEDFTLKPKINVESWWRQFYEENRSCLNLS